MGYSKEKQESLIKALENIAGLVGAKHKDARGETVGLDMQYEQKRCQKEAAAVRDGLFKVVVMGAFSTGKSTVINALIGSKVLPDSIRPCTAILTFIQYGQKEDIVEVHLKDKVSEKRSLNNEIKSETVEKGAVITMTANEFYQKYKYSIEDEEECACTGTVARFSDVDYAIMHCSRPLMEGGVRIIDSPGLEDKVVASEQTLRIANEAQATIYIGPDKGFNKDEREYIHEHFKGCPNNVFFVLNRMDLLSKTDREEILHTTRTHLKVVFKREDGTIDTDLMDRRVFGISALRALDSRRGMVFNRDKEVDIPISEEERAELLDKSEFIPFEKELEHFLTTDDKCLAQYKSAFQLMSATYRKANDQVEKDMDIFENNRHLSEEQKTECSRLIEQIRSSIQLTEQTFDNCSLEIQNKVANLVTQCTNSLGSTWDNDLLALQEKTNFSMFNYIGIALNNINIFKSRKEKDEAIKKSFEPFAATVAEYISKKIEDFFAKNKSVIDKAIADSEQKLNIQLSKTDHLIQNLGQTLTNRRSEIKQTGDQGWLQSIMSFMMSDISASVLTAAGGRLSWMDYVKRSVVNYTWQFLLATAGGGVGAVIALLIEAFQMNRNRKEFVVRMLSQIKENTISDIRHSIGQEINKINKNVAIAFNNAKNEKCGDDYLRLDDEERHLSEIEKALSDNTFNARKERQRCDRMLAGIVDEASNAYKVVMGHTLTKDEFINM